MCESVSVSSGPMWMNCDAVQHAVQRPHGTSDAPSPRIAPCTCAIHAEKSPPGCGSSFIRHLSESFESGMSTRESQLRPLDEQRIRALPDEEG